MQEINESVENDRILSQALNVKFQSAMKERFPTAEDVVEGILK